MGDHGIGYLDFIILPLNDAGGTGLPRDITFNSNTVLPRPIDMVLQSFFLIVPLCSLFTLTIYLLGEEDTIHT